ncbi:MAG: hypothetical protein AABM42_12450 [Actinomycetota bacterium]
MIAGLYIAQTTDRIYLARLQPDQRLRGRHKAARRQPLGPTRCYVPGSNVDEDLTGVKGRARSGRIFSVNADGVRAVSIGELQSVCGALEQGPKLARELKAEYGNKRNEAAEDSSSEAAPRTGTASAR